MPGQQLQWWYNFIHWIKHTSIGQIVMWFWLQMASPLPARGKPRTRISSIACCCGRATMNVSITVYGERPIRSWRGNGKCHSSSARWAILKSICIDIFYKRKIDISVAIQATAGHAGASIGAIFIAQFNRSLANDTEISSRGATRQSDVLRVACVLYGETNSRLMTLL